MAPKVQVGVPPDTFVSAEPSIAGRAPVSCDAGRLVKLAPLTAGSVAGNLASGTVPDES